MTFCNKRLMAPSNFIPKIIGMVAIFVTALWGMYQNMTSVGPLGG